MGVKVNYQREEELTLQTKRGQEIHRSADRARDIDDFLDLVAEAWEDYQNRFAIPRANWVPVKYMRPKEFIESFDEPSHVILFKVHSRKRFNSTPDGQRRARVPAVRETITDPDDETQAVTFASLKRENMVEFEVWATHSKKANELALQFEAFMQAYDWYFTDKGINRVWFEERLEDRIETTGATEWSVRTLRFQVITELIYKEVDKKLQLISIRYDAGGKLKSETLDAETGLMEHSIDRGTTD